MLSSACPLVPVIYSVLNKTLGQSFLFPLKENMSHVDIVSRDMISPEAVPQEIVYFLTCKLCFNLGHLITLFPPININIDIKFVRVHIEKHCMCK